MGTQLPRARVSPLATGQQSPTSPTWSCSEGQLQVGHYYNARITEAEEFDLYATIVQEEI